MDVRSIKMDSTTELLESLFRKEVLRKSELAVKLECSQIIESLGQKNPSKKMQKTVKMEEPSDIMETIAEMDFSLRPIFETKTSTKKGLLCFVLCVQMILCCNVFSFFFFNQA